MGMVLLTAATAWSHGVQGVVDHCDGYLVKAAYDDGEPMSYAAVEIKAPDSDIVFQTGRTDRNGHFMLVPDQAGQWQIVVKDEMGHRLALALQVAGETATPKGDAPRSESTSVRMGRSEKIMLGLSIILGLFGFLYGWQARRTVRIAAQKLEKDASQN
jgi:nickel transport protein